MRHVARQDRGDSPRQVSRSPASAASAAATIGATQIAPTTQARPLRSRLAHPSPPDYWRGRVVELLRVEVQEVAEELLDDAHLPPAGLGGAGLEVDDPPVLRARSA